MPASTAPTARDAVGAPTRSCSSPSGASSWSSTGSGRRAMAGTLVVDGRNALDAAAVRGAGLVYEGVGTPMATMQAVILAGGEGTRLRPLTSTVAKPVVTLVDRPFIAYMLEWLRRHGVNDVVMSCGFLAAQVRGSSATVALGVRLHFVEEPEPLGTGGAVPTPPICSRTASSSERRHPHRHRPRRPARPARAHRRARHAGAGRGRGSERLRPRALHADGAVREFVEKPSPGQSTRSWSAPGRTCSSAACSS